ncbi:hypothetical protein [Leptolyngbya ohadii]|uniref:hypothetical protein n=1 Tax=Leptolyngbya ohadii TaxID=1962290 RepID=UPI000B59F62E|nr:hypothetical protein [Leptolyngbya ohadii]
MTNNSPESRRQIILNGVETAVRQALERHRKLGESIAIWRDGKVVVLEADQIAPTQTKSQHIDPNLAP